MANRGEIDEVLQALAAVCRAADAKPARQPDAQPARQPIAQPAHEPRAQPARQPDAQPTSPRTLTPAAAALLRRHGLAPLAYRAGYTELRSDFVTSSLAAELRESQLAEALAALAAARIPAILLKGISYAPTLYADPAERPMTDIDLMVPPPAHRAAVDALCRLGYWRAGTGADRAPTHHAVTLKRTRGTIDLHRRIVQPWRARVDERAMWRRAQTATERTDAALRLDPTDELLVHLLHMARHELMVPLINYVDAARLLARESPQSERLERAAAYRVARANALASSMTRRVIARKAPSGLDRHVLPSRAEITAAERVWRPLQLARKVFLVDGPLQLAGLVTVAIFERLYGCRT